METSTMNASILISITELRNDVILSSRLYMEKIENRRVSSTVYRQVFGISVQSVCMATHFLVPLSKAR